MSSLILLKPYLDQPNFRHALRDIAWPYRASLGLSLDIDELGLVCPDVVEAATWLENNYEGMGPFFLAEASPIEFKRAGQDLPYRTRVGFGYYQDVLIELAEPGAGDTVFSTHLDPGGAITIHHVGYFARGKKLRIGDTSYVDVMAEAGHKAPSWHAKVFGGVTAHITIYDTYAQAENVAIEFLDYRVAGIAVDYPRRAGEFFARWQKKHGPRIWEIPGGSDEPFRWQWSFHAARVFPRSAEELWPWVTDPALMSQWMGGVVTGPPVEVGAERRIEMELDDEEAIVITHFRSVQAPIAWVAESTERNDLFRKSHMGMTLTGDGDGTRIVWHVNFIAEASFQALELAEDGDEWMEKSLARLSRLV